MGKSRLVYEFRRSLTGARVTYLEGRCLSYGGAVPYLPILDILRDNCGLVESDGRGRSPQKVRFGLREVGMEPARLGSRTCSTSWACRRGRSRWPRSAPEAIKARTFETLRQMALQGSQRRPIIFVVEDLHWIDETSEEYLASLVESLAGAPILLLCTYRPGYRPPWIDAVLRHPDRRCARLDPRDSLGVVQLRPADRAASPSPWRRSSWPRPRATRSSWRSWRGRWRSTTTSGPSWRCRTRSRACSWPASTACRRQRKRLLQTAVGAGPGVLRAPRWRPIWDEPGALEPHLAELKRLEFLYEQSRDRRSRSTSSSTP